MDRSVEIGPGGPVMSFTRILILPLSPRSPAHVVSIWTNFAGWRTLHHHRTRSERAVMKLPEADTYPFPQSRRRFAASGAFACGLLAFSRVAGAQGAAEDVPPATFMDDLQYADLADPYKQTGSFPPDKAVEDQAQRILAAAPTGPRPYDIAKYFVSDGVPFAFRRQNANKAPWNPVVREMIIPFAGQKATDMTPWCACFVNWVLNRAHRGGSGSAGAISFLDTQRFEQTTSPREGDLIVYRFYRDADGTATDAGHVGFRSAAADNGGDLVLGGNQWTKEAASVICLQKIAPETPGKRNGEAGVLRRQAYVRVV